MRSSPRFSNSFRTATPRNPTSPSPMSSCGGLGLQSAREFPTGAQSRERSWAEFGGSRRWCERLDRFRPSNRPDRQDHSSQALYRGRDIRRHSTPRRVEGADMILAINTDKNAPIFRLRAPWRRHRRHQITAGVDGGFPQTPVAAQPRSAAADRSSGSQGRSSPMIEEKFDAIVIGAGMAGNAAAYTMASRG